MRTLALTLTLLTTLSACDKEEPTKPAPAKVVEPTKTVEKEKPPAPKPEIGAPTGLFTCKAAADAPAPTTPDGALPYKLEACPTVPGMYGKLAFGMDAAAAGKAAKAAKISGSGGYIKVGKKLMHFGFSDAGTIDEFRFKMGPAGLAAMEAAWGAPLVVEFLSDKNKVWLNPAAKIKVIVSDNTFADAGDDSEKYSVRYALYTPLVDLLGPDGLLSKPVIGSTGEDLQKNFGPWLEVKTAEQAKADTAKLGLDAKSASIAAWAGANEASAKLKLPQSETRSHLTFSLDWKDKKVSGYGTSLSYGKDTAVKAEIPAIFAAALGAPTEATQASDGDWTYIFAGPNGTKVKLRNLSDSWSLDVTK